ncbi:unnamed protein product [Pieris brassicae]|uniref:Cyclin-dependent kinase inhibitor domain-containing protein n=1 Tax=Pieris brassicae TaxID=7116 RepID=A0A9P0T5D5_PIEBR|nr:unnamed protein product [Pieris brassicae]
MFIYKVTTSMRSCIRVFDKKMSALSVRAPGLQATMLNTRSLRVQGETTIDTVRRNLFGCTDKEENRRFVERELARQLDLDSQRWGFDFANEKPLAGDQRFAWQLVPAATIPAALRRSPITITQQATKPVKEAKVSSPNNNKTQKPQRRMTDFLRVHKRPSSNGAKSPAHKHKQELRGVHIRPPKVARLVQTHFKRS